MKNHPLIDVQEGEWFEVDSNTAIALLRLGERVKHSLKLSGGNPITLGTGSARCDGIAGAVLAQNTSVQISPKFLQPGAGPWVKGFNAFLNYAGRDRAFLAPALTQTAPLASFVDNTAHQFCEMLEAAARGGLPRTYSSRRATGLSPRGRLNITASIRNIASLKPTLEWDEVTLNEDAPTVRMIRLALQLLARQCRDARVQRRVELNLGMWPVVPAIMPSRVPILSRSFAHFAPVAALAYEICLGLGHAPGTERVGYAYVVDMVRTFERTVERSLVASVQLIDNENLSVARQRSVSYANALTSGARDYYSRPDAVVYERGVPLAVVDAKYKSFEESEYGTPILRPSNSDFYQVLTAAIAYRSALALLVYPTESWLQGGAPLLDAWRIPVGSTRVVTLAAAVIDVVGLSPGTSASQMHLHMKSLLEELMTVGGM